MILMETLIFLLWMSIPAKRLPIKNCVVNISYRPKGMGFYNKAGAGRTPSVCDLSMVEESETSQGADVVSYTEQLREACLPIFQLSIFMEK